MMYKIIFSAIAIRDEADAYLFYEDQSEGLGEKFLDEIHEALLNISHHPTHYSYTDETKTMRDVSLNKFPFKIIFHVSENEIIVYTIHHTKKNLK